MLQEFQVLQCFNCETFQVDIVKKVSKWCCKICGEKQSIKNTYGKGTGKDCRLHVQTLNKQRLTKQHYNVNNHDSPTTEGTMAAEVPLKDVSSFCDKNSKWSEFTENPLQESIRNDANTTIEKTGKINNNIFEDEENDLDLILDL